MDHSKHTPGPWHVGMKPGPIVYGAKGAQVCDMRAELLPLDEELANLRLILAAPDMLAALEQAEKALGRVKAGERGGAVMGECSVACERVREAISQAKKG